MTLIHQADAARQLGISTKTLDQWITQAHLSPQAHPIDRRILCLTTEQVQHLATLHGISIRSETSPSPNTDLIQRLHTKDLTVLVRKPQVAHLALQLKTPPEPSIGPFPAWWHPQSAELGTHARTTARIEYDGNGTSAIIDPHQEQLLLTPNSSEWFAWLASLDRFRFVGPQGPILLK